MSLLREIQVTLLEDGHSLAPIFLKLRLLASRLGSVSLEEWVKMEAEGYPNDVELPAYRKIGVSYSATFSGPFGRIIKNAPIPSYLINKYAGSKWIEYEIRQGISAIDDLIKTSRDRGFILFDASNLIFLLQGNIYEDYDYNSVQGTISGASLAEIQHVVRSRILELTLELEKSIPNACDIVIGFPVAKIEKRDSEMVTQITHQIVHGNITNVSNSGSHSKIDVQVTSGSSNDVRKALIDGGILESDANEFTDILASEEGGSKDEPFGIKAKEWIVKNIPKAIDGTWNVGIGIATTLLKEAALKYYGLK